MTLMAHARQFIPSSPTHFRSGSGVYARPNESAFIAGCRDLLAKEPNGKTEQHNECRAAIAREDEAQAEFEAQQAAESGGGGRRRGGGGGGRNRSAEPAATEAPTAADLPAASLPVVEEEGPSTLVYVAGGVAVLGLLGGLAYYFTRD